MFGDATTPDPSVKALQAALAQLSTITLRPNINPISQTGIVDDFTASAVVSALDLLTDALPASVDVFIQAGLIGGATTAPAKAAITEYAPYLAIAAQAAVVKYGGPQYASTFLPVDLQPWYTTPFGIAVLLGGGFLVFKLIHKNQTKASA